MWLQWTLSLYKRRWHLTLTCNFIELRCPCSIHSWFKYSRGTTISDPLIREVLDAWRLNSNKLWNLSTQKYPQAWSKSNGYGIVCGVRFRKETHRLRANRQWTRVGRVLHGWKKNISSQNLQWFVSTGISAITYTLTSTHFSMAFVLSLFLPWQFSPLLTDQSGLFRMNWSRREAQTEPSVEGHLWLFHFLYHVAPLVRVSIPSHLLLPAGGGGGFW